MTSDQLTRGLEHHQHGRLAEAEQMYREVLRADPYHSDAWHLLGMVRYSSGDLQVAAEYIQRAIGLCGDFADYHNNLASVHSHAGRFSAAAACCREAIRLKPDHAQAYNNLGNALVGLQRFADATAAYQRAVELQPAYPLAWANAGYAWQQLGNHGRAVECCQRALELDSQCIEALNNLANVQLARGQFQLAVEGFQRAREVRPDDVEVVNNLGVALQNLGRWQEAIGCHRDAIALEPTYLRGHVCLAAALRASQDYEQAEQVLRQALQLDPQDAWLYHDLGELLWQRGLAAQAEAHFRQAIQLEPHLATAHFNLGSVARSLGQLDQAEQSFRRACDEESDSVASLTNLAAVLSAQGRVAEALPLYEQARRLAADDPVVHSNLLVCRQYLSEVSLAKLAEDHSAWGRRHGRSGLFGRPAFAAQDPAKSPLRLGFVSRDLRLHPVAFLLMSTLEALDRRDVSVICYADHQQSDSITDRIKQAANEWRDVSALSDDQLTETIRGDRLDLLFDLAGHTSGNRLLVFARRPVPIQVTWLGYVGTTGLDAIDYLIADRFHVRETEEQFYTERIVRLADSYACYSPPLDAPAVAPLPALELGNVTFGCFNNPAKLTDETLRCWGQILSQIDGSRLLLKYHGLDSEQARSALLPRLSNAQIATSQVVLEGHAPQHELLQRYRDVDIALDTSPYSGGVTTCEALWMGVPVVTQPGPTFAGRHATSYLTSAGLTSCIAESPGEYVRLAVQLAGNLKQLAELRAQLRSMVSQSPLCDAPRFAAGFEQAIRSIWRRHCEQEGAQR